MTIMSAIHTFEFEKGRTFVSGLFWQPLTGQPSDARNETRKLAKEMKFDLAVWRNSSVNQVGFAVQSEGVRKGVFSAAALVSKTLEVESGSSARDFLCATPIPGGRWLYVAQREGVILPDGDLIGNEDEIRARLLEDFSIGTWPLVIAPDHWAIHGAKERDFDDFLPRKNGKVIYHSWWALKPVDRFGALRGNPKKALVPLLLIAGIGYAGAYGYKTWKANKAAEEARLLAEQQAAALASNPQLAIPEHPWKKLPRARMQMNDCMKAFSQVKSMWPGNWSPQEASCANGAFTIAWKRQEHGWIEHLRAVEPNAIISRDGTTASLSLSVSSASGEDEALLDENTRVLEMQSASQKYRFTVTVSAPAAPVVMPGQENAGKPQQVQDWRELKWDAKGIALPDVTLAALDGNGFRLDKVTAVFTDGGVITWNMEGKQYVKP